MKTERTYSSRDLRNAIPHRGQATIELWEKRGLLAHGPRLSFNDAGISHGVVVSQLSDLGVFQAAETCVVIDDGVAPVFGALTRPDEIVAFYERCSFDCAVTIFPTVEERRSGRKPLRGRTTVMDDRFPERVIVMNLAFGPHDWARDMFNEWNDRDSIFRGYMPTLAFISVRATYAHVCRVLGLPVPKWEMPSRTDGRTDDIIVKQPK